MKTFRSKIDTWLSVLLIASALMCGVIGIALLWFDGDENVWGAFLVVLIGGALPIWPVLTTKYVVTGDELHIRSGPFSWRVDLTTISSVEETRNPLSSPAMSLDRLAIHYGDSKTILVSPVDKAGFRAAIGVEG